MESLEHGRPLVVGSGDPFAREICLYEKCRRPGDLVVAVCVPDPYRVGQPNLGHQHVEYLLNRAGGFFAYRIYLDDEGNLVRECDDPPDLVVLSMSYECSYTRAPRVLDRLGITPERRRRAADEPLVVAGGLAVTMNPLPLFEIADLIAIGDAGPLVGPLCSAVLGLRHDPTRLLDELVWHDGWLVPPRYEVATRDGYLERWEPRDAPRDIRPARGRTFPHSWYLSPDTDYNVAGYYEGRTFFALEIVKACASKCLFCATGHNAGPVRFAGDADRITRTALRARARGADLTKLFLPANADQETTKGILRSLLGAGLAPRIGSVKAERIDPEYLELVARGGQEKLAIAPETADEQLRASLGKPRMTDAVLERVVAQAVGCGIPNLDFYMILNLPGETSDATARTAEFLGRFAGLTRDLGLPGRFRASAPNFFPKPWTPFQYAAAGDPDAYHERAEALEATLGGTVRISHMVGQADVLSQNLMARGGVEAGRLLLEVHRTLSRDERSTGRYRRDTPDDWRRALDTLRMSEARELGPRDPARPLPWHHVRLHDDPDRLVRAWEVFRRRTRAGDWGRCLVPARM